MKKLLKILGLLIGALFILIGFLWLYIHESKPVGEQSPEADQLAQQMMAAVNKPAWDTTRFVQWTFADRESFIWDRRRNFVQVSWKENKVLLNINNISGIAWQAGRQLSGEAADELVQKAWSHFCNDSFWLNAVTKAFDPGTERSIVELEDGRKGLKVDYSQGGVTPGDAYVWILDENNRPTSWKMWVKIIPVGGLEFSWERWTTLATGAQIATFHNSSIFGIEIKDLKAGNDLEAFGFTDDPFSVLGN